MAGLPDVQAQVAAQAEILPKLPEKVSAKVYYRAIRINCQTSLWHHVKKGMGYDFVHESVKDLTDWLQSKWNPIKPRRKNILIQTSRDAFKSTSITQSFPSWCLSKNPNLSILIISKVYTNAQNFLNAQRERFEQDEFTNIFGDWKGKRKWGDDKLIIDTRTKVRKEPSIMVAGAGTELTSLHFDIIIVDDGVTKEDMYSKAAREQSSRLMKQCYDLLDKRKGLLIVVGTCWHEDDELEKIKKSNERKRAEGVDGFEIYERPAERFREGEWQICWPFFSRKILDQVRADKADIRDYTANYRLLPLPPEALIFSEFQTFDYREVMAIVEKEQEKKDQKIDHHFKAIVIFVDPSLKDTKKADFGAVVCVGRRKDNRLLCLDADIKQRKPSATILAMQDMFTKYKNKSPSIRVVFETVMFQEYMKDDAVNKSLLKGMYIPISGHPQKENKIQRITNMEKFVSSGQILFRADWKTLESYSILMDQLKNFPMADHDDGPDALEGAVRIAKGSSLAFAVV